MNKKVSFKQVKIRNKWKNYEAKYFEKGISVQFRNSCPKYQEKLRAFYDCPTGLKENSLFGERFFLSHSFCNLLSYQIGLSILKKNIDIAVSSTKVAMIHTACLYDILIHEAYTHSYGGCDHCCTFVRPSVPTFQNLAKQNNYQVRIVTGRVDN